MIILKKFYKKKQKDKVHLTGIKLSTQNPYAHSKICWSLFDLRTKIKYIPIYNAGTLKI